MDGMELNDVLARSQFARSMSGKSPQYVIENGFKVGQIDMVYLTISC